MSGQPSDLAIVLALQTFGEARKAADEVRGRLKLLGFDCTAQQVAAWLKRLAREDAPLVDVQPSPFDPTWPNEYAVTRFGRTYLQNKCPGIRPW